MDSLLRRARAAYERGQIEEALSLAGQAIDADSDDPGPYLIRAGLYEHLGRFDEAVSDYDRLMEQFPQLEEGYQRRGGVHFKRGEIEASIADFDKAVELDPRLAPYHWQRGISYYYAGRFEDGVRQFESHQTVNPNDVENAFWHFLCKARLEGIDQARKALLPIEDDPRMPMMTVYSLLRGGAAAEDVVNAAQAAAGSQRTPALFYAHLYVGLFHEVNGNPQAAREHITTAAEQFKLDHYMWHVARVHAARIEASRVAE